MKYFKLLSILILACTLGSCTTLSKTSATADVNTFVAQYPAVVDLEIAPTKVSKTVSWSPWSINKLSLEQRKSNVTAELLQENDADVLVERQYIYDKHAFSTNKLTVIGYPATYKNFRKATPADLEALRCGSRTIQCVSDEFCPLGSHHKSKKDKKKRHKFLGIF